MDRNPKFMGAVFGGTHECKYESNASRLLLYWVDLLMASFSKCIFISARSLAHKILRQMATEPQNIKLDKEIYKKNVLKHHK